MKLKMSGRERETLRKMKFGVGSVRFDFVHSEES
jgi:hypothetical protein